MAADTSVKRLSATERDALMCLSVADQIITNSRRDLKARMSMIRYGQRDLAMIERVITNVLQRVLDTMPAEQIKTYTRALMDSSFTVGHKCPSVNNEEQRKKDYGMWLPFSVIEQLTDACHEKCSLCGLDTEGIRRCPLRKALDTIPNDVPDGTDGGCPYYSVL